MPTILDCIDEFKAIQIDEEIGQVFGIDNNRFQYLCLDDNKDCEHQYILEGFTYCTGNREGAF